MSTATKNVTAYRYQVGRVFVGDDGEGVITWEATDRSAVTQALTHRFTALHVEWLLRQLERGHRVELNEKVVLRFLPVVDEGTCRICGGSKWVTLWPRGRMFDGVGVSGPCMDCNAAGKGRPHTTTEEITVTKDAA